MKKIIFSLLLLANLLAFHPIYAITTTYQVKPQDIHSGYILEKIWLENYAVPEVLLSGIGYATNVPLPKGASIADPNKIQVQIGMERKRPFAVVRIPAYVAGTEAGATNQVNSFTLIVNEKPQAAKKDVARTTDVTTSVLNNGTWYKIGITKTGFYTIDYNFIKSLGLMPANVNPADIRVFGNGGRMLSENNAVPRATDLLENALSLNDNGDNVFDLGESAVFYATGPTAWNKDSVNGRFTHLNNLYTDTAYYFITVDQGPGLRISGQATTPAANQAVTSFNYYAVHDSDGQNPAALGKNWYGEGFYPQVGNTSQVFAFNLGGVPVNNSIFCTVQFASTADAGGNMYSVTVNNNTIGSETFPTGTLTPSTPDDLMDLISSGWQAACTSPVANVGVNFTSVPDGSGVGYLDFIEINARLPLTLLGDQMNFRDWKSVGAGNIAGYQLQNATGNTRVWDVTNPQVPVLMNGTLSGTTYTFAQDASMLHEFAAMNTTSLYTPNYSGAVVNQNLHGLPQPDLIIVTNPEFLSQANQLADYHIAHDKMRVVVATTDQVYNEFSSGAQDISAIRDFARMFYKRATNAADIPRYLLLFGGASYDYKNRVVNNSNFVPVFESAESLNDLSSFCTDDFYGFLDDSEYIENDSLLNILDIGVGRLPARNVNDANSLVTKAMNYNSPATLGPWRIASTFVADNADGAGDHLQVAEVMAATVTSTTTNLYNEDKIYIDAIGQTSTPAGFRCPNANAELDNDVYKGVFLINYNGHGNTQIWADERILTEDDYNSWANANMLPFMVTATCDFGQFDHPSYVSAAEQLVIRSGGGDIAILTTTQAVYSNFNQTLNSEYLAAQFKRNTDGSFNTFGDGCRLGKNTTYITARLLASNPSSIYASDTIANFRKFSLLGDPALTPDFPQNNISIDSVIEGTTLQHADTIKALGAYIINGSVRDLNGNTMRGFNGNLSVSFYDKVRTVVTVMGTGDTYPIQDNVIYKGRATVTNGLFSVTFIAPKDINYFYGAGKISAYADNGVTDGAGNDSGKTVGGYSDHPQLSSNPPVVKPYINDSLFLNGGITGSNTSLFVSLFDETGINVSGTIIGHDLTAVLDNNVEAPYILNDSYETAPNSYQRGTIYFPITGLADGKHSITVTAWDVNDNMGQGTVDFVVVDGKVMDIQNLMTYPNPFTNTTTFSFEHNHPNEQLNADIEIYSTSGALVKTIKQIFTPTDSRTSEIVWDGTDNSGGRLPTGVYIYRLNIASDQGFRSSAYQKLLIER